MRASRTLSQPYANCEFEAIHIPRFQDVCSCIRTTTTFAHHSIKSFTFATSANRLSSERPFNHESPLGETFQVGSAMTFQFRWWYTKLSYLRTSFSVSRTVANRAVSLETHHHTHRQLRLLRPFGSYFRLLHLHFHVLCCSVATLDLCESRLSAIFAYLHHCPLEGPAVHLSQVFHASKAACIACAWRTNARRIDLDSMFT